MIEVEHLTRTYGSFKAVDDVSFQIKHGEVVGLLGHNGAGKTTIMKMLTGFLEPSDGKISIDNYNIDQDRLAIQHKIGYLPENSPTYPEMSVIDYLVYTAGLRGVAEESIMGSVKDAIMRTDLLEKADKPISTLSRGYRQRVGVAQAILHKPQILILDEPTNGLDPSQILDMRALIKRFSEHATVILSTHILQEVQAVCDRVLILRNGKLALDSRLEDLKNSSRLLVTVDQQLDTTNNALGDIANVDTVEFLHNHNGRFQYALQLKQDQQDPLAPAPEVARRLLDTGCNLYGLYPEQRDLETIFGEINSVHEGGANV